jgi:hypothetical protein
MVRACLWAYYQHFEYFDMLTFPITYATPIGESDNVEVHRISPADSKGLWEETASRRKLAGTKLGNFGAFFKEEWRKNDLLWGRLDGAERLINALVGDEKTRLKFQAKAWLAILNEKKADFSEENLRKLQLRFGEPQAGGKLVANAWQRFQSSEVFSDDELQTLRKNLKDYFEKDYVIDPEPSREESVNALARSIEVVGRILDGLVDNYQSLQPPAIWLARLGKIFTGVVQVAMPGSLLRLFFRHWLRLAYVFELFLIIVGALLGFNNSVTRFGVVALLTTLGIDLAAQFVGSYIQATKDFTILLRRLARFAVGTIALAMIILAYLGLVYLKLALLPPLSVIRKIIVSASLPFNPNLYFWIADSSTVPVLAVLIIFSVILASILYLIDRSIITKAAPKGISSFELAGSRAKEVVDSWSEAQRHNAVLSLGLDYLYLSVYPLALSLACHLATTTGSGLWLSAGGYISWLILAAIPLDALEDFALIRVLQSPTDEVWPLVARWCAIPKFALVFLGFIYLLLWLVLQIAERVV